MSKDNLLTRRQCRAARGLLGWSQERLAEAARVSPPTVTNFENGISRPMRNNLLALRTAMEQAGVVFIPANGGGPGVRLKDPAEDD